MTNKIAAALLFLLFTVPARPELLKVSLLKKPAPAFTLKLDIFNGAPSAGVDSRPAMKSEIQAAQVEAVQKNIAEEIFQSIVYEGYVSKNSKKSALLNVSGEFFMVSEQDLILDKIRILKISQSVVTIEYEGQPYDLKIKGDENG